MRRKSLNCISQNEGEVKYLSKIEISDKVLCAEYEAVFRYTLSICRNETEAEDITQETFLKALNARQSFQGGSSLYTWLCSIAKNLWINRCKKNNREVKTDELSNIPVENRFQEYLENKDNALEIHKVLHILNEPYKEVFTLRVFGELSFSDIAKLFSKTESWARVTYHRSKKIIISQLRKGKML